ncbi:hypothetical protein COO60DRAFT_147724 [Scenedesmus sp. NREL 46B-D3]|nr:hypothetical protein COO60DRAFT_147724 [Scenedesmus sp. NREL 46B-D3]
MSAHPTQVHRVCIIQLCIVASAKSAAPIGWAYFSRPDGSNLDAVQTMETACCLLNVQPLPALQTGGQPPKPATSAELWTTQTELLKRNIHLSAPEAGDRSAR